MSTPFGSRLLVAILAVAAGLSGACLFEPANETALRSRGQLVEFRGVSLVPRATVRIQAAAAPGGPFAQIASTSASALPTVIGGAVVYEFSVSVAVPAERWAQTCEGSETFVRALGGSLVLTTYDSEAIAGVSPEECIADEITGGLPFPFAATACASDYGAPARLTAAEAPLSTTVLGRDLRIVNPYQAADYACLSSVQGDLRILDPSNQDLAFPDLAGVTGDLEVRYPREPADAAAREVDLPVLASVGGDVSLQSLRPEGPNPGGVLAIDFGLPVLDAIGGALSIVFEGKGAGFDSVAGLPALATLAGNLTLRNNFFLDTTFTNLLQALTAVGGDATVRLGLTCNGALRALAEVDGDFSLEVGTIVSPDDDLADLAAIGGDAALEIAVPLGGELPGLAGVGGSLSVRYNAPLAEPSYLVNLASVGGELGVFESGAMPGEAPLQVGSLELDANPGLVDIATTLSHLSVFPTGAIAITDNPNISDCEAQDWVDSLPGHNGPVTISGNDSC